MKKEILRSSEYAIFNSSLGATILNLLKNEDETIEEIMRNPDGNVWIFRRGAGEELIGQVQSDANAKRTIEVVASASKRNCTEKEPIVSGEIPGLGYRFQGMMPNIVASPAWSIRIPSNRVFTLDDYVDSNIMTAQQKEELEMMILRGDNILVVGGTRSGKTTLLNGMLTISSTTNQRHVLIEDTYELRCNAPNKVHLHSNEYASIADLLEATLRLSPKRIIIGEARRGLVAETMLMAANTGHQGIACTIHANSAKDGLLRIEELLAEAGKVPVPRSIVRALSAVIYIQASDDSGQRKIKELVKIQGFQDDYILTPIIEEAK